MKRYACYVLVGAVLLALFAGCATPTPEVREVVKEVTKVVKEVVKETVVVEGTPKVIEKEVTKVVKEEVQVVATPTPLPVYEVTYWQHSPWTRAEVGAKEDDFVWAYIRERYNLDITIQPAPSEGGDAKLNAMIAAGEIPDILQTYWGPSTAVAAELVRQGVLIPIEEYLPVNGYLQNYLTEDEWVYLTFDGTKYGLAQPRPFANWDTIWVRVDWLENLNLEVPTTVEELADVALAFTTQDPDGNGQNDTYGFTARSGFGGMQAIFAPFGAYPGSNHIRLEGNEVVFEGFSPWAKEALTWWNAQVEAGVVDPDWTAHNTETWRQAVAQERAGIVNAEFQFLREGGSASNLGQIIAEANPNADWEQVAAVEGPFGAYVAWKGGLVDTAFYFTRQADSEPGKMDAIMRFMNDAMNPDSELYHLMVYGQPGLQYRMDENGRRTHRFSPAGLDWFSYWLVVRRGDEGYFWYYKNEPNQYFAKEDGGRLWDRQQFSISEPQIVQVTPLLAVHELWPDLNAYMQEMHIKFATGEEPLENWDDFIGTAKSTYGFDEVMADAVAQLKAIGLVE